MFYRTTHTQTPKHKLTLIFLTCAHSCVFCCDKMLFYAFFSHSFSRLSYSIVWPEKSCFRSSCQAFTCHHCVLIKCKCSGASVREGESLHIFRAKWTLLHVELELYGCVKQKFTITIRSKIQKSFHLIVNVPVFNSHSFNILHVYYNQFPVILK